MMLQFQVRFSLADFGEIFLYEMTPVGPIRRRNFSRFNPDYFVTYTGQSEPDPDAPKRGKYGRKDPRTDQGRTHHKPAPKVQPQQPSV